MDCRGIGPRRRSGLNPIPDFIDLGHDLRGVKLERLGNSQELDGIDPSDTCFDVGNVDLWTSDTIGDLALRQSQAFARILQNAAKRNITLRAKQIAYGPPICSRFERTRQNLKSRLPIFQVFCRDDRWSQRILGLQDS